VRATNRYDPSRDNDHFAKHIFSGFVLIINEFGQARSEKKKNPLKDKRRGCLKMDNRFLVALMPSQVARASVGIAEIKLVPWRGVRARELES
jgi:hypothetical protein